MVSGEEDFKAVLWYMLFNLLPYCWEAISMPL